MILDAYLGVQLIVLLIMNEMSIEMEILKNIRVFFVENKYVQHEYPDVF